MQSGPWRLGATVLTSCLVEADVHAIPITPVESSYGVSIILRNSHTGLG